LRQARPRLLLGLLALAPLACGDRGCGGLGGRPPAPLPIVKEGQNTYRVVDKGAYKAYYDTQGQLVRILHDSNGDGRPDRIAHYKDGKTIFLIEIDQDGDGWIDRWQVWEKGRLVREDLDTDGDGKPDRRITYDARGRVLSSLPLLP
jgi:hypothetical protein